MNKTKDMTAGNPTRLIFVFSLPLLLTNICQQLYQIADASIVGKGIGVKALAAVGATDWTYWIILWTITTMTQGFATFISRYYGEHDYQKMNKAIANSVMLTAAVALVLTIVGLILTRPALDLLKTPADIRDDAVIYLSTMVAGSLAVAGYNIAASILRALGDGRSPMVAMIIAAVLNIGLDVLTVFVFRWGVFGAALSSIVSQLIAFLYCLRQILRISFVSLTKEDFRPDFPMMKKLFAFGLPLAMQYWVINISGMVMQSTINLQGSNFIAGYTAMNKIYGLLECSAISLSFSATTFFSQNYGAKQFARIRSGMRATTGIAIGMALTVGALMAIFGRQLLSLFIDFSEAGATEALAVGYRYVVTVSACLIILYLIYVYRSILHSVGSSIPSMLSGFTEFGGRVLVAKVFFPIFGLESLFFAEPAAWLGSLVFIMASYYVLRGRYLTPNAVSNPQPQ